MVNMKFKLSDINYKVLSLHLVPLILLFSVIVFLFLPRNRVENISILKVSSDMSLDAIILNSVVFEECGINAKINSKDESFFIILSELELNSCSDNFRENPIVLIKNKINQKIKNAIKNIDNLLSLEVKEFRLLEVKDGAFMGEVLGQLNKPWHQVRFDNTNLLPLGVRKSYLLLKKEELKKLEVMVDRLEDLSGESWITETNPISARFDFKKAVGVCIYLGLIYWLLFVRKPPSIWLFSK